MSKKISPNYTCSDWPQDLSKRYSPNWGKAIDILRDRFDGRYFKPLEVLVNHDEKSIRTNVGFIVMSIDCLLIETLNQFYLGLTHTREKYYKDNPDDNFRRNWQAFRDFFKHSKNFSDFKIDNALCKVFFDQIRCGLLHQAESKVNSLINLKEHQLVKRIDASDLTKGIIINRNIFHECLVKEFEQYYQDLGDPKSTNIFGDYLRDKCNRKMVALCS
jgi:hypothetical protein